MNNTILITGAYGSVGLATAKALAKSGKNDLLLAGRDIQKLGKAKLELQALNTTIQVDTIELDLSSYDSIDKAIREIKNKTSSLQGLLNVAAVFKGKRELSKDGNELIFATNHLGVFRLTYGLLDLIRSAPNARVVTVTAPSFTKLDFYDLNGEKKFSAMNAFGASKMANLLFTYKLSREFRNTTNTAIAYHPGLIKSDILNEAKVIAFIFKLVASNPEKTGIALARLISDASFNKANGKFFNNSLKEIKSNEYSHDPSLQDKLWNLSLQLLKLSH